MSLRVLHVAAGLAPADGGPAYSVPRLASALRGHDIAARCISVGQTEDAMVETFPAAAGLAGRLWRASPMLCTAIESEARAGAVIHAHGLWLAPNLYPAQIKRRLGGHVRLVHAPRGMLAPEALRLSAYKKWPLWHLAQKRALMDADCLHATAPAEVDEIRAMGLRNPIAMIPNGMDLPLLQPRKPGPRTVLSLGRVHPKKNLDVLLHAWAKAEAGAPDWRLVIRGPAEKNHDKDLRLLVRQLGLQRAEILGPAYGDEKWRAYRAASLFVLPTRNENFGLTVAEALACETPVISTKGAPWSGLDAHDCGWWIDHGAAALAEALSAAMRLPPERLWAMGEKGRKWMAEAFSWDQAASAMRNVYLWLDTAGVPPSCVQQI